MTSRREALIELLAHAMKQPDTNEVTTDEVVGSNEPQPIDLYARVGEVGHTLEDLLADGTVGYTDEFTLEATRGTYTITAEDDTVIIEYEADE